MKSTVRKFIFLFVVFPVFVSCNTSPGIRELLQPDNSQTVTPRLLRLEFEEKQETMNVTPARENTLTTNSYLYSMFEREMDNITELTGEKHGHFEVTVIYASVQPNYVWL